jgi:hypothetical protein
LARHRSQSTWPISSSKFTLPEPYNRRMFSFPRRRKGASPSPDRLFPSDKNAGKNFFKKLFCFSLTFKLTSVTVLRKLV